MRCLVYKSYLSISLRAYMINFITKNGLKPNYSLSSIRIDKVSPKVPHQTGPRPSIPQNGPLTVSIQVQSGLG